MKTKPLLLGFPGFLDGLGGLFRSDGAGSKIRRDVVHHTAHVCAQELVVDDLQIRRFVKGLGNAAKERVLQGRLRTQSQRDVDARSSHLGLVLLVQKEAQER